MILIQEILLRVLSVIGLIVAVDVGVLSLLRSGRIRRHTLFEILYLPGLVLAGLFGLARVLQPSALRLPAVCLYLSVCLGYMESRSMLARGYSLRILIDLLHGKDRATLDDLKTIYGGGVGVKGMLDKRLRTLRQLCLLHFEFGSVGPLTFTGRVVAGLGAIFRKALRLDVVG